MMKSAAIGKRVEQIGKEAFADCEKLQKIIINSDKIKKIGKRAFLNLSPKARISIAGSKKYYKRVVKMIRKTNQLSKKVKFARI